MGFEWSGGNDWGLWSYGLGWGVGMRRGMRVGSFIWVELALILVLILSKVRWYS